MNEHDLVMGRRKTSGSIIENSKSQSLKDKTGATAKQIRQAIEKLGFDRNKVEQYLLNKSR